jgi:hypothetical protein
MQGQGGPAQAEGPFGAELPARAEAQPAKAQEQELATIKNTIGWKALNKYRETREKSAVLDIFTFSSRNR